MTVKDFKIESSIDGKTWNTLYTDDIPNTSIYNQVCEFNPTHCKYIRCIVLSTHDWGEFKGFKGADFKIYGTLVAPALYTNLDAYGILKKE